MPRIFRASSCTIRVGRIAEEAVFDFAYLRVNNCKDSGYDERPPEAKRERVGTEQCESGWCPS